MRVYSKLRPYLRLIVDPFTHEGVAPKATISWGGCCTADVFVCLLEATLLWKLAFATSLLFGV